MLYTISPPQLSVVDTCEWCAADNPIDTVTAVVTGEYYCPECGVINVTELFFKGVILNGPSGMGQVG